MWNCNIAMSTHKLYLGCVSFYRKRYSGLPSLQNKCFLFLILLNWHYTQNIYFFHRGTFLLDPELPNVSKFSRDVPTLLHQKMKLSGTNFWNWHFPLWDRMLVKRYRSKDLLLFLLDEGICHVNLEKKNPQILRLKHKLAALQRSAEELFVCC